MPKFIHLHVHSHYSLLDGLAKIDELIKRAKEDGSEALALTDHGVMYGAIEFYQKCKEEGIKPIIGVEAYLAPNSRLDKIARSDEKNYYHLILLAKNNEGYKNLIKLTTIAHLEGYYYKPRIDWEVLQKHSAGLIGLTACIGGEIPALILAGKIERAKKRVREYNNLFGQGNFYLEIQDHPDLRGQDQANAKLIEFSRELNIPLVATNDVHYLNKEDDAAQDVLLCLQNKKKIEDRDRMNMTGVNYSMRSGGEIAEVFKYIPEAIENTVKIADMCDLKIELGNIQLPFFKVPEGEDGNSLLRKWCEEGMIIRYGKKYDEAEKELKKRMDYELEIIKKMGWPSYFLIVADFVNWAKKNKIVVGPGRGSAAGSLVCYLTGITNLDPLKYDLLFERFLNPDRISMPDIDLDFADIRRDEVIEYVENKYGSDHVAQIITFGTMAARAAVRDVGRVLNYPYDYCDKLAKMIPMFMKLDEAIKTVPELKEIYKEDAAKKLLDFAKKLEGVARHASTHACGVLITKDPLNENVPLQYASSSDRSIVSQYSLHPIEDLGLLKMDFLGLKNLTIIESAIKIIKNTRGLDIDIEKIPLDDKKTYKLFQKGETTGVFQFECLSGDTIVSNTTIKKLYEKRNKEKLISVYLDEGKTHKNKILNIARSGEKEVYTLIAENNRFIKATKNHNFLTKDGWKKLGDIKKGEEILIKIKSKYLVYNNCSNCGKQISGQKNGKSNFCYQCSAGFYKNPSKKETRGKISASRKSFFQNGGQSWNMGKTAENNEILRKTGRKIHEALIGRSLEERCGAEKAKEIKLKLLQKSKGKNNPMFGKPAPHRKGGFRADLGHYVRSSWEADFARILKLHRLNYEYEPQTFSLTRKNGETVHYTPDFFVKANNTFYEIKGWMHKLDEEKINLFKNQYSNYNFVLVSATKFAEFALKYKKLIKWECPKIPENGYKFIKIKEIKYHGKEMTYDIEMEAPGNNFIANGFVAHNSSGMKRYMRELKPTDFEDIIAMVALYRPGPMEWIPDYISGKKGKKKPNYLHPKLEPILNKTYGVAIYQEQVMQMARDLAGFTMAEADVLRKAMGKKILKLLTEQKEKFIDGCVKNIIASELAEKIFSFIEPFAGYGFNRSHAACYALIGYQTAYLKAHWPTEFMAALLTADQQNIDRIAVEIEECRKMGIEVKSPDINQSFGSFTAVTSGTEKNEVVGEKEKIDTIRFGLKAIKNVGENISDVIIKERKKNGPFKDITNFIERVNDKDLNKKSLESLAKSGALDKFAERGRILGNMESLLQFSKEISAAQKNGQESLFAGAPVLNMEHKIKLAPKPEAKKSEILSWEKELLGVYISAHPLTDFKNYLINIVVPITELSAENKKSDVSVAGVITSVKKIMTRSNESMLFVKIEDTVASVEILVFPRLLKETPTIWQEGKIILCGGKISDKDQEIKLLVNKAAELTADNAEAAIKRFNATQIFNPAASRPLYNGRDAAGQAAVSAPKKQVPVPAPLKLIFEKELGAEMINKLRELFSEHAGASKVYFKVKQPAGDKIIETGFRVNNDDSLSSAIIAMFGNAITIVDK